MKKTLLTATIIGFASFANAQVGIGNTLPNAKSILDLTNSTNGKSLILPKPITAIDTSSSGNFDTEAMLFYYQDKLFLRTSTGINVLSPWIFDGTNANGIYVATGIPMGVGIAPLASSTAILTVADAAGEVTVSTSTASIVVGDNDFNATHMLIDKDELLVKTDATTAGILKLQEDGGSVVIRGGSDAGVTTILTAHGSVDAKGKIKENGNDLLPVGSIIMWTGSTVPAGWALCDGGTYTLDAGGTMATPNLLDKFIIAADITGGTNQGGAGSTNGSYAYSNTGGGTTHSLVAANLPQHAHESNSNGATLSIPSSGAHTHIIDVNDTDGSGGSNVVEFDDATSDEGDINTQSSGAHTHTITGNTGNGVGLSGSAITHGLPPYFALAYIMKL